MYSAGEKRGATLDLSAITDFVNQANEEIGKFQVTMILSPDKLAFNSFNVASLNWDSIKYGPGEIDKVPADRRGVYAFSISQPSQVLPPHGHILYIGIAGRKSGRSRTIWSSSVPSFTTSRRAESLGPDKTSAR